LHPATTFATRTGDFATHSLGVQVVVASGAIDVVARPQIASSPSTAAPGGTVAVAGGDFG
jgi:hypothetical protein